jgi:hypothetical protein
MYKEASRFSQYLARKGAKRSSRRKGTPLRRLLVQRLDQEVKNASRPAATGVRAKPTLVKRRAPTEGSNEDARGEPN